MPERILKPQILTSEKIASLSWQGKVFFYKLLSVVDDFGRFDGRDKALRAAMYPFELDKVSEADVRKWKRECAEAVVVSLYTVEDKDCIALAELKWTPRAEASKYPTPPTSARMCAQPQANAPVVVDVGVAVVDMATTVARERKTATPFTPPTVEVVGEYGKSRGIPASECQKFHDHHSARGWRLGRGLMMKDWQAALRTWEKNWRDGTFAPKGKPLTGVTAGIEKVSTGKVQAQTEKWRQELEAEKAGAK